jgi:hypothetical protein
MITTRLLGFWLLRPLLCNHAWSSLNNCFPYLVFTRRCLVSIFHVSNLRYFTSQPLILYKKKNGELKLFCVSLSSNRHLYIQVHPHKPRAVCAWLVTLDLARRGEERTRHRTLDHLGGVFLESELSSPSSMDSPETNRQILQQVIDSSHDSQLALFDSLCFWQIT